MAILSLMPGDWSKTHPAQILLLLLICIVPAIVLYGYFVQFGHNEIHEKTPLLPNLESGIGEFLKNGAKLLGVTIIYTFIFALIAVILGIGLGVITGIIAALINFKALVPIIATLFFIPFGVFVFILFVLVEGAFFDNFNFKEALDYKRILMLVSKAKGEIAFYILFFICFTIFTSILTTIVSAINLTIILSAILLAIGQFISVNIKAQIYKIAKSRMEQ